MDISEIIQNLKQHNNWRRGHEDYEMIQPKKLGETIDGAIYHLQRQQIKQWHLVKLMSDDLYEPALLVEEKGILSFKFINGIIVNINKVSDYKPLQY